MQLTENLGHLSQRCSPVRGSKPEVTQVQLEMIVETEVVVRV